MKRFVSLALISSAFASAAHAEILTEDFETQPFSTWKSRWFGQNTTAEDYYVVDGQGPNVGSSYLWLAEGPSSIDTSVNLVFNTGFRDRITSFGFSVQFYVPATATLYDKDGSLIGTTSFNTGGYSMNYSGLNGLSSILFQSSNSSQIEGNFYVDNLRADVQAVPEPATFIALGLGAVGVLKRRKRSA